MTLPYQPEFWMLCLLAYLLGSIPWGLVIGRWFSGEDIRLKGSGNIGATNVHRIVGWGPGLLTLFADTAKGALAVWVGIISTDSGTGNPDLLLGFLSLAAVLGHLFSCFLKFKGGKGIATTAGCFLVISPGAVALSLLVFLVVAFAMKRISPGSLAGAASLPVAVWWLNHSLNLSISAWIIAVLIFYRHKDNIRRLLAGTEPVWKRKK
jgi:glycerol-3-phosphate acyltransferase PlsY